MTRRQFLKKGAMTMAGLVISSSLLGSVLSCASPKPSPTPLPTQTPTPILSPQQQYHSQIEQYLRQDVPALMQYKSAFDYAVDRITTWQFNPGIVHIDYQSIRQPLKKWIDANITWQNKGERLYGLDEVDFLSGKLFDNSISQDILGMGGILDNSKNFENNVAYLVSKHDEVWKEMHNPDKLKYYFDVADRITDKATGVTLDMPHFKNYKQTLWQQGTDADRISFATYGYAVEARFGKSNEERARVEFTILYLLSIGGEAQRERMEFDYGGHGEPAFKISPQLDAIYHSDKSRYGTPLESGYLTLPYSVEGAEAIGVNQVSRGLPPLRKIERHPSNWKQKPDGTLIGELILVWQRLK